MRRQPSQLRKIDRKLSHERLQARSLFAADLFLADGLLTVEGDSGSDDIHVGYRDSAVVVSVNGTEHTFDAAAVSRLQIVGKAGDDRIVNETNVAAEIDTGSGHDAVFAADGDSLVKTGSGNDTVVVGHGRNVIDTGSGDDSVTAGSGVNTIDTGSGHDRVEVARDFGPQIDERCGCGVPAGSYAPSVIRTGSGEDMVIVGDGNFHIDTGSGSDQVQAGHGNNRITTGSDGDWVTAGDGDNVITTGGCCDMVAVGDGDNAITTGDGDDVIRVGDGDNFVDAGDGIDAVFSGMGDNIIENDELVTCLMEDELPEGHDAIFAKLA